MITQDKVAHFYAGLAICLAVSLFVSPIIGFGVAILAGVAKEIVDKMGFGTADPWDFVATAVGGLLGFVLILISEALA